MTIRTMKTITAMMIQTMKTTAAMTMSTMQTTAAMMMQKMKSRKKKMEMQLLLQAALLIKEIIWQNLREMHLSLQVMSM